MQAEIQTLLTYTGKPLTLRKLTQGSYNVATGNVDGSSYADTTVTGHLVNYKNSERGELIRQGDRKALIAAKGMAVEPTAKDRIRENTTDYEIVSVHKITKNATIIAYVCQVRV